MNPRTTLVLALLTAALGTFLYFYEIRGEEGRARTEAAGKRLFKGIEADEVGWIELRTSDERDVRLERAKAPVEGWRVTSPVDFPADDVAAEQLASALVGLSSDQVLEDAQAPAVYGLGDSARVVRFGTGSGELLLRIGDKAPVGPETYAQAGSGAVVTIATYRANALNKRLDELRDRRVAPFDRSRVEGITVSWPGGEVVLARAEAESGAGVPAGREGGGEWRLTSPQVAPADGEAVDDLLGELSFLRAEGFIDELLPGDPYGLEMPALEIEVRLRATENDAARSLRMEVGSQPLPDDRVAVRAATPQLYQVRSERIASIPKDVTLYRFRDLARFEISDAAAFTLDLSAEDGRASLALRGTRDEADWVVAPQDMQTDQAAALVSEASRLVASQIAADSMGERELAALGVSPPRTRVRVFGDAPAGGEADAAPLLADFKLGRIDPQRGLPAMRADSDTVYFLDPEAANQIPLGLEAFDARFAAPARAASEADEAPRSSADPGAEPEPASEPGA